MESCAWSLLFLLFHDVQPSIYLETPSLLFCECFVSSSERQGSRAFFGLSVRSYNRSNLLDTIFENETIRKYFSPETYHVIDYHQEFDEGIDGKKFPDYDTQIARFFNTDTNTTTGFYKMGDVETGATMTLDVRNKLLKFKTMPYADNRYNLTEPFLIYDLKAKIMHEGNVISERIIKEEDVLAVKKIFVVWH